MAKAAAPNNAWSVDDLPTIAQDVEAVGAAVSKIKAENDSINSRLLALEQATVGLDSTERMLPAEIIAGISPAAIFQAALMGVVQANIVANPHIFARQVSDKVKNDTADRILDQAVTILNAALRRAPAKTRKAS
jgi:hypothetical protein